MISCCRSITAITRYLHFRYISKSSKNRCCRWHNRKSWMCVCGGVGGHIGWGNDCSLISGWRIANFATFYNIDSIASTLQCDLILYKLLQHNGRRLHEFKILSYKCNSLGVSLLCVCVYVSVCSMYDCVCLYVCMSSCLSLLLRHLCSMLIVSSFCCVYTLTPAYTHTHTRRQVNKHACITKAVKTLARTNEHGNNISYTVWQPLHTHTHTYAACCIWMCAKASLKLLLLTDKGLGTAAAQI